MQRWLDAGCVRKTGLCSGGTSTRIGGSMDGRDVASLTPRERDVLRALAEGRTSKQVGQDLGLTVETVRSYTKAIYATLDVHNRAEATMAAVEAGLTGPPVASGDEERRHDGSHIPPPARPVIGREGELVALQDLLRDERLVTIVGIGGAGKTVLAQTAARTRVAATRHRGALVLLEHVDDESGLGLAIADGLGVRPRSAGAPLWSEMARLADDAPCLLVLDNLEHLVGHADRLVELLAALPSLRLLVTSREPLGVTEEAVLRIDGLSVPAEHAPPAGHGAVDVFVAEVVRLDPQRRLGQGDLATVGQICRSVDGWPLAVVLAAGWTDVLSLDEIARELLGGSDLLTSKAVLPERHRSLDALVDASITRRPLAEQQMLARMSVFEGGADRDAVTAVAGRSLQRLATLIRASLVRHDPLTQRYDLHPLVRGRAEVLLQQQGQATTVGAAHRDHYAAMAAIWAAPMAGRAQPPGQREAVAALHRERDNLRAAWQHASATGESDHIAEMFAPLTMWLDQASELLECEMLLTIAIDAGIDERLRARLILRREYVRVQSGSIDPASREGEAALARLVATDDDWVPAGEVIVAFLEASVLARPEQALERARRLADAASPAPPYWRHRAQLLLGFVLNATGDPHGAVRAHLAGAHDAIATGDHSAAHVLLVQVALGLIRVHRLDDIPAVLARAEALLDLHPHDQTEASIAIVRLLLAAFAAKDVDRYVRRLEEPALRRVLRENQHVANVRDGALALARGAGGDRSGAAVARRAQDDRVAGGILGESVLWAEIGIALAALADGDLDAARQHLTSARPWEQAAGLVTSEVDMLLEVADAVARHEAGAEGEAAAMLDRALSSPSLLTTLVRASNAVSAIG